MTDAKPRKPRQREPKSQPAPTNGAERLKTVVRRLPPNLPEDIFWQSVQAWVSDDTIIWKSYFPGKMRTKRMNGMKEGIPSRAYIAFRNEAQVAHFSREYDGHVFRDKAGNESQAVVEYAPFQKIPSDKKKADARTNTIERDDDYLSFLDTLTSAKSESRSFEALVAASQPPPPPTTTPLLEALKAEKSAQKDKEAILRNHAHYKDSAAKKEEGKKKAPPPATPTPSSKRAKKAAAAVKAVQANIVQQTRMLQDGHGAGKTPPPLPTIARHRPSKEHARGHAGKGDASAGVSLPGTPGGAAAAPPLKPGLTPAAGSSAPDTGLVSVAPAPPAPGQGQGRKARPVIGLGRHFEAALSGTGVGVGPPSTGPAGNTERKKRDKGGDGGGGPTEGGKEHRDRDEQSGVVPGMLQRPLSPRVESLGEGGPRGGRRGRGRGRGGHRGG